MYKYKPVVAVLIVIAECVVGCAAEPVAAIVVDAGGHDVNDVSGGDASGASAAACGTPAARSTCHAATLGDDFYLDQAQRYFDALDRSQPPERVPTYSTNVMRWEWPPWLFLTGFTRKQMDGTDKLVKANAPAVVSHRDCRVFAQQPFARCRVSFDYDKRGDGKPCWIYEEFTFNSAGELTFIEAWSDLPGLGATDHAVDPWAQGDDVHRLSTRVPGLGTADGYVEAQSPALVEAAATDAELADLRARMLDFWPKWVEASSKDPDYFTAGCGW